MKKLFLLSALYFIVFLTSSCRWGKATHSFCLKNSFIVEFYKAGLIGNLTSMYVIDNHNKSQYIGTYDSESDFIHISLQEDSLIAEKYESRPAENIKKFISRSSFFIMNGKIISK